LADAQVEVVERELAPVALAQAVGFDHVVGGRHGEIQGGW
jgi:hypothetical protein